MKKTFNAQRPTSNVESEAYDAILSHISMKLSTARSVSASAFSFRLTKYSANARSRLSGNSAGRMRASTIA